MEENKLFQKICEELTLKFNQVKNTIDLLDQDSTVPFIARYRKEVTGSLDEDQIRAIQDRIRYLRNLEERKQTVLKSIEEQGKLTPDLQEKISNAEKLQEVEDLYLPFKPKRRTRATIAKERGLEPFADIIMAQETEEGNILEIASAYLGEEIKTAEDALSGARDIISERISENAEIRQLIRTQVLKTGFICSESSSPEAMKDFESYIEFSESVKTIPPHRILAINRGERESMLRVWIDVPDETMTMLTEQKVITNSKSIFTEQLKLTVNDAYHRLIAPAIQREVRKILTEKADDHAIHVFAENLKALLLIPPMRGKKIMGIDPGYRTGCKVAVIDETGKYLQGSTIYPHQPQNHKLESKETLRHLIETYHIQIVAIGNGTASRETEQLVAELIGELDSDIQYTIVNEAGASVYSASPVAKQEFPGLEASLRGNISIARRLLDPLSELVKIDPKSIGVGLYQHDVDQNKLSESLDQVVETCVNAVGVDLNTASMSLLKYVSGINNRVAENIVKYRDSIGKFSNREELKKVQGLGENCFLQAAGFLRIPESSFFLDTTAVHPESYQVTLTLLEHLNLTVDEVRTNGILVRQKMQSTRESLKQLAEFCGCGQETLSDIIDSLEKPNRDPRDEMSKPILRSDVLSMEDLHEGMILKGTVRNVVDFGAFVDIGVKQDGLIHLSQMARHYVKHPLEIVKVGDIVDVKIMKVEIARGRIGLSLILDAEIIH